MIGTQDRNSFILQKLPAKHIRHYRLGELVIVGEATTLAMRTNINKDSQ